MLQPAESVLYVTLKTELEIFSRPGSGKTELSPNGAREALRHCCHADCYRLGRSTGLLLPHFKLVYASTRLLRNEARLFIVKKQEKRKGTICIVMVITKV